MDSSTVQGSRPGPILYALQVSLLFDIEKMKNYADDNFIIKSNKNLETLVEDMEKSLEAIIKWLKKSGWKVYDQKTDLCLFHHQYQRNVLVSVNAITIHCNNNMNVLGVIFDSKLQIVSIKLKGPYGAWDNIKLILVW